MGGGVGLQQQQGDLREARQEQGMTGKESENRGAWLNGVNDTTVVLPKVWLADVLGWSWILTLPPLLSPKGIGAQGLKYWPLATFCSFSWQLLFKLHLRRAYENLWELSSADQITSQSDYRIFVVSLQTLTLCKSHKKVFIIPPEVIFINTYQLSH